MKKALAIGAHPDDIEFMMSGTLIRLAQVGYETHYMTIANGSCGTIKHSIEEIISIRTREAKNAANSIGAIYHHSLVSDFEILYNNELMAQICAVIRQVEPSIMLVHSPEDYMEDHMNASRLVVSAAFGRGMKNFTTNPPVPPITKDITLYHALPYGLMDGMRRYIRPGCYVDVSDMIDQKRDMLAQHKSQKEWLDVSQGQNAYLDTLTEMCRQVGRMSGTFQYAEGWRRHSYIGFSESDIDPLLADLGPLACVDEKYERQLKESLD